MPHPPTDSTVSRREFLRAGAAAAVAAAVPGTVRAAPTATADACIFLMLTGGPSQLDTFDPKSNAPSDVRGPFKPIRTAVPGLHLSELFPRMAAMADKFSLVRSLHHTAAPIHETGFQLVNTGRLFRDGPEWPNAGAVVGELRGRAAFDPFEWVILPYSAVDCGVKVDVGQSAGWLASREPTYHIWDDSNPPFSDSCFIAARYIERGTKFVTVNMYPTVFDAPSWDCHADRGSLACDLNDYRDTVAPMFDTAFTALLTDLDRRGLLDRTLVVATGEFGRTPHPNANGGRDHWPGCWTAILAGGGVKGGRVVGSSDALAGEPKDRPVTPAELVATIYHALGIPPHTTIPGPDGTPVRVIDAAPVGELF
jgi:hypothetical protein